jgi:hypothetical protein
MKSVHIAILGLAAVASLSACRSTTLSGDDTGATATGSTAYTEWSCERLTTELAALEKQEAMLASLQNQNVKGNPVGSSFWGIGSTTGNKATELSVLRNRIRQVNEAMKLNGCGK